MAALENKVALVTGAGNGIGRGIARRFAREGAAVVIAEIDETSGKRVAEEIKALGSRATFVRADVSKKADVQAMIEAAVSAYGSLDVLVNNAVRPPTPMVMAQKTDALLEQQLAIGLWGPWWACQAAMPVMRARGGGSIINFSSIDFLTGAWMHADYNIMKGGVVGLTRSAAIDWARYNIRVNAIAPAAAGSGFEKMVAERPELREMINSIIPLGRIGDPEEDIAPVAVFLASEASRFMTGAVLDVDGGVNMNRMAAKPDASLLTD